MEMITVPAGEVIFNKGEQSDAAYVIKEGVVEIFEEGDEGNRRLALLSKGTMFGEYGVLDGGTRSASARCVTESTLSIMPLEPSMQ
ncbi:MAG: cyclic nucleotide-binding domain-containing protein [Rickettsiales bacterium]|nr:cyclic nucleotide-binding domain-containing protein [Rickettsiales bacterium]